jgi:predicted metal-dependent hydrolase
MEELMVLGRDYALREDPSATEAALGRRYLTIPEGDFYAAISYLGERLYTELENALQRIRNRESIDLFGNIDFEIVGCLRDRRSVIARYKGRKILVKSTAIMLPKEAIEYLVAHEIAHIVTTKHSRSFMVTLETLYPDYRIGRKRFHAFRDKL